MTGSRLDAAGLSREIWRLAIPAVLQNLLGVGQFVADTVMVGRFGGDDPSPLAAMAAVGPLVWSLTVLFTITSVGATAIVARRTGEGRTGAAERATATALALALGLGVAIAATGLLWRRPLIDAFTGLVPGGAGEGIAEAADRYLYWFLLLFPLRAVAVTLESALRGAGESAIPLWGGVLANVANIVGNAAWIFGLWGAPRLGVEGAGLSTALAPAAEIIFIVLALAVARAPRLPLPRPAFDRGIARELVRISAPAFLGAATFHAAFLVYQLAVLGLEETSIAAHRVAITLQSLGFMPAAGFSIAAASLSGRLLGAGERVLAREAARRTLRLGLLCVAPISLAFLLAAEPLAALLTAIPESVAAAALCLRIGAIEIPFLLVTESLNGTLRGAGATRAPMRITAIGAWGVRVPLAWALAHGTPLALTGIWIATVTDWLVRGALTAAEVRRGAWLDERV